MNVKKVVELGISTKLCVNKSSIKQNPLASQGVLFLESKLLNLIRILPMLTNVQLLQDRHNVTDKEV